MREDGRAAASSRRSVNRLLPGASALVLLLIVAKAASADITWDESWTFLHYGRTFGGFARLDYANNHVLNSIAIYATTQLFGSSIFAIRLPNVLSGLLYLAAVGVIVRRVRAPALTFALLVFNPYLIEHFALARGYGMAAAILASGLAWFAFARPWHDGYASLLALALLASFAIASDVTIVAALVVARAAIAAMSGEGLRGHWLRPSIAMSLAALVPLAILLRETRPGVPVFGSSDGAFGAIAAGVARMFVADRASRPVALASLLGCAVFLVASRRRLGSRTAFLLLASAAELVVIEAGALCFHKLLPTGRLLVPSLPLWTCALVSAVDDLGGRRCSVGRGASAAITVTLLVVFLCRWHTERFLDWKEDAGLEARVVRAVATHPRCLPWNVWSRYGHVYYLDRWFGGHGGPPDIPCPKPG